MFHTASLSGRPPKAGCALISSKTRRSDAAAVSVLKACSTPPPDDARSPAASSADPVRDSSATARLPCAGAARMRAMPEPVAGPAPRMMARPFGWVDIFWEGRGLFLFHFIFFFIYFPFGSGGWEEKEKLRRRGDVM